jgi:5'-nucleotidase (lipoprotein e(P4) family)
MLRPRFPRRSLSFLAALLAISSLGWQRALQPTPQQTHTLNADLWMQTSGEYVACCLQTYRLAGEEVERAVKEFQATEAGVDQSLRGKPPAVIMDLDETVLDNATYQTYLYDSGQDFTVENFSTFVTDHHDSIRLIPGAKQFIDRLDGLDVTILYITDRPEAIRQATIDTLAEWGISTAGLEDPKSLRLLMANGEPSKTSRRDAVRAKYRVLALVGDQLGDFSDEFNPKDGSAAARREAVWEAREHWGSNWFILPQPVYGQWQKVLSGDPAQYLQRAQDKAENTNHKAQGSAQR